MSLQQPLCSFPKLVYLIARQKTLSVNEFEPFSIEFNNLYANSKQLLRFQKQFGDPNDIPTFAFITAFKASLQTLSQAPIASPIMGLIHLSSEFQILVRHNWCAPFDLKITIDKCEQTDKGLVYTVVSDFYQYGTITIRNVNTMLSKDRAYQGQKTAPAHQANEEFTELTSWTIKSKTAWSYARLSGDFNPIHIHKRLAKAFGLRNMVIHGMYNASKALAEIKALNTPMSSIVSIHFNKPCFVPNKVKLLKDEVNQTYGLFSIDGSDRYLKLTFNEKAE